MLPKVLNILSSTTSDIAGPSVKSPAIDTPQSVTDILLTIENGTFLFASYFLENQVEWIQMRTFIHYRIYLQEEPSKAHFRLLLFALCKIGLNKH